MEGNQHQTVDLGDPSVIATVLGWGDAADMHPSQLCLKMTRNLLVTGWKTDFPFHN